MSFSNEHACNFTFTKEGMILGNHLNLNIFHTLQMRTPQSAVFDCTGKPYAIIIVKCLGTCMIIITYLHMTYRPMIYIGHNEFC